MLYTVHTLLKKEVSPEVRDVPVLHETGGFRVHLLTQRFLQPAQLLGAHVLLHLIPAVQLRNRSRRQQNKKC